jgi:glutamine amidotransferase
MKVGIINYNLGNPKSIANMLRYLGINTIISSDFKILTKCDYLIVPGVGHFAEGMRKLMNLHLEDILFEHALTLQKPILGICLGMQLLTNHSEEGNENGLGLINARTRKFKFQNGVLKIPHMGWNNVTVKREANMSIALGNSSRFYFVHSYYVECENEEDVLFSTTYGIEFVSGFQKDNIIGVQFHPEKSHKFGMQLLTNFCNL